MKAVITQPNLFPWLGYFHQVKEADVFIVLDNVQYNKREWQNRNRIVMRNGVIKYLTIPVKKAPQKTQIANIYVSDSFNPKTLSDAFASAYANTPLFDQALNTLDNFLALYASTSCNHVLLRDLNVNFIKYICDLLGWSKTILFASDLMSSNSSVDYSATARLVQLCKIVDEFNIPVLAYGIRTDFQGELFEGSKCLLAWAENLVEIKTICHCGRKATMVVRLDSEGNAITEGEQIEIGGNERYLPLCRKHFHEMRQTTD